jgi:putative membrane protein
MSKSNLLMRMGSVAALLMMFGMTSVHAQAAADTSQQSPARATDKKADAGATLNKRDQAYLRDIANSNLAEIEVSKLAMEKSQDDKIKAYAKKMVDDHTKAQQEVEKFAQAKNVSLPDAPDKRHQKLVRKLEGLSGESFDRVYIAQAGYSDHKHTDINLKRIQRRATDPDLKALAGKLLPEVDKHLAMAEELRPGQASARTALVRPDASGLTTGSGSSASTGNGATGGPQKAAK